jgi:hypothetical protein
LMYGALSPMKMSPDARSRQTAWLVCSAVLFETNFPVAGRRRILALRWSSMPPITLKRVTACPTIGTLVGMLGLGLHGVRPESTDSGVSSGK